MNDTHRESPPDPNIGRVIDDEFTIVERLGSGGIGTVYRAVQHNLQRDVAIKLLHDQLNTRHFWKRFCREARITCLLEHPNIVRVFKFGQSKDGALYLVMEYIEGVDLGLLLPRGRTMDGPRALQLMLQIVDAVAYAHTRGVVHRDLKPENVIITKTGRRESIKLLDFGMAKLLGEPSVLTLTGVLCGSPYFIAPELWEDTSSLTKVSDLYSLGCLFYLMVAGTLPFLGRNLDEIKRAHLFTNPPTPDIFSNALEQLPELADIILTCLRKHPDERYSSAEELLDDLERLWRTYSATNPTPPPSKG